MQLQRPKTKYPPGLQSEPLQHDIPAAAAAVVSSQSNESQASAGSVKKKVVPEALPENGKHEMDQKGDSQVENVSEPESDLLKKERGERSGNLKASEKRDSFALYRAVVALGEQLQFQTDQRSQHVVISLSPNSAHGREPEVYINMLRIPVDFCMEKKNDDGFLLTLNMIFFFLIYLASMGIDR